MKNSGLLQVFSSIYAENSAKKMIEGKQYERAMRAHDLLSTVLKKKILNQITIDKQCLDLIEKKYNSIIEKSLGDLKDLEKDDKEISIIIKKFEDLCKVLSTCQLNKLWLLYIDMVDLLHTNLMAERLGYWDMYLKSLKEMLPYFAGCGHNNYTRSVYWFLLEMNKLPIAVLEEFEKGLFVVRRTK